MSNWHLQQLKFVFGIGGFMSFYGGLSLAIYFLGEYGGIDVPYRITLIAVLLLTMPIALVIGYFATRKKGEKPEAETPATVAAQTETAGQTGQGTASAAAPSGNFDEDLNKSADEVVKFLKSSNLGTMGDALYSLPWYLVTGATKSGKTSLVLGSDLNFQNLPSQRQSEQKLIRPTRQIDWRVTSDAVFLDTPGRLQNGSGDGDEWATLLETVKKHRSNRPLDGLILTVNTEKILHSDESEIEELAKTIRTRLDDATKRLKIRFPVYLVFTHADAIEGFRDSFSASKKEGENLVWGATIPLEKSDNAQALFDSEYEVLQDSIMKRRLIRLSAPFSPVRQLRIFNFPLHFGSARRKLGTFVTTLFRPNPFSESPFLRGFYFTAVPVNRNRRSQKGTPVGTPQTVGETFFTKRFFRDVILRDKDLVKTFQDQRQKPPILGWFLTFLSAFIILVLLGFSGYSLYRNHKFVEDATNKGQAVLANVSIGDDRNPLEKPAEEKIQNELDAIENLRKILVVMDDYERNGAPIYMRFGLYSGNRIFRERLLNIYYSAIQRRFRQPTIRRLETELQKFATSQTKADPTNLTPEQEEILGKNYSLLEAYLMLSEEHKERAVPAILADSLKEYWISEAKLPSGNEQLAENQLNFYFKQIKRENEYENDRSAFPRITPNSTLVKNTRAKLENYPAYLRYLRRIITGVSKRAAPVTVETLLDARGQGVLSGGHEIPGAFTIEGYRDCPANIENVAERCVKDAIANAAQELKKEDWVMGRTDSEAQAKNEEITKLQDRYFNLYIDNWRELIRKTKVIEFKKLEDMNKALQAFSDTESPMKILLMGIGRNTKFSSKPPEKGWFDLSWISDLWGSSGPTDAQETNIPVERQFSALFKLLGTDKEIPDAEAKALIDETYGRAMETLNQTFGKISQSDKEAISKEIEQKDAESDAYNALDRSEKQIDSMVKGFKTNAEKDIANLLKEPIAQIRNYFGEDALSQLKRDWAQRILPKAQAIEKGYPFTDDGEADLTELSKFLNPANGELSMFYKNRLADFFEEKNEQLVVKESSKYKFSPEFVQYLNNAFRLRDALYGKTNETPNFKYDFRLMKVENAIIEVTLDGQKVTSEATGSSTLGFPAAQGASTGVLMRFASTADTSSTSGGTLPATSSANSSDSSVTSPTTPNYQQDSGEDSKTFQGTWGLFKFVDAGSKEKIGDEYALKYTLRGTTVKATIKPQGGDLFNRSIFTLVKAPQTIIAGQ
jgi:type VI secretion system protein ImpL